LRSEKSYHAVLHQLLTEALAEIAASSDDGGHVCLEADPLDQDTLSAILAEMGLDLAVQYSLSTWGGVVARSDDGRIVVINTLETRLERALPYLRHNLAALFEDSAPLSDESLPELSMPTPTA
jgi:V/A-type H+-transporting ATPase subunit E